LSPGRLSKSFDRLRDCPLRVPIPLYRPSGARLRAGGPGVRVWDPRRGGGLLPRRRSASGRAWRTSRLFPELLESGGPDATRSGTAGSFARP